MTLIDHLPVSLNINEVHRLLGYPEDREPPERIQALIEPLLTTARSLLHPRGGFLKLASERAAEIGLEASNDSPFVIGLVTIGEELEAHAARALQRGEATAALILEAAGSVAAEETADRLSAMILDEQERGEELSRDEDKRAPLVGCRISPGYDSWPLESQRSLFGLLPSEELGVRLNPSMLMLPRKSISFALWLGPAARVQKGCRKCSMHHCPFRRGRARTEDKEMKS